MTSVEAEIQKRSSNCSVPGCDVNKKIRPNVVLFDLPKNPQTAKYWLKQICLLDDDHTITHTDRTIYICEEHFEENAIIRTDPSNTRLNVDAAPTLKLPSHLGMNISTAKKRNSSENTSPQYEKKIKTVTNAPCRNLDGGAVPSLQPTLDAKSSSSIISKAKEQSDKLGEPTTSSIETLHTPQSAPVVITDSETSQVPQIKKTYSRRVLPVHNIQEQTQTEVNREPLYGMIKGASTFTLSIHNLQMLLKQKSDSSKSRKQLALRLYLRFPTEYNILHQLLYAPPKSELKCVLDDSFISCDKGTFFSICLIRKASTMTVKQRECFLSVGETKIKPRLYYDIKNDHVLGIHDHDDVLKPEPATTAMVLIVQGIFEKWKQPIALSFLGNTSSIKPWVAKNIKNLAEIGFNVRAVVSHMDFKYFNKDAYGVNKKKIFCLSDLASLFIGFYFNFTLFDYSTKHSIAKSQYIKDYFKLDSNKQLPITPKITNKVLYPASITDLDIKSVMEVFSTSTAAAITAYIDFNLIDESARFTVYLITQMNKLYYILSAGHWDEANGIGFTSNQPQIYFLTEMLTLFDSLEIEGSSRRSSSVETSHQKVISKFKMLIKVVLSMSEYLKLENYESLPIGRFTTDAIDSFFNQVQKFSKSITKPTAREVYFIFKQTTVIHLLKRHATQFKLNSMENVLNEFHTIAKGFTVIMDNHATVNDPSNKYTIHSSEYATLDVGRKDGVIFIAGFLLKKCTDLHKDECKDIKNYITNTATNVETLSMCESIMDDVRKSICMVPTSYFIEFVEAMEIIFRTFIKKEILCVVNKKMLKSLLICSEPVNNIPMPCVCFPAIYLKKLYIRYRIYLTLKFNNELNRTKLHTHLIVNKL